MIPEFQRNMQRRESNAEFTVYLELKDRECRNDLWKNEIIFLDNGDVWHSNHASEKRKQEAREACDPNIPFIYPDIYLRKHRIVVEIDGHYVHTKDNAEYRDDQVTERLTTLGFNVYRLPYKGVISQTELKRFCDLVEQRWKY